MVKITLALLIYYTTCTWFVDPAFNSRCQTVFVERRKTGREVGKERRKEGGNRQRIRREAFFQVF